MPLRAIFATAVIVLSLVTVPRQADAATVPAGFTHGTYASGMSRVTAMAFAPDGRLFVLQQAGAVRVIKNGVLSSTPFVTLDVDHAGERGLNAIAFDPNFATNKYVYLYYTAKTPASHNRVSRFVANGDVALTVNGVVSETPILDLDNVTTLNHMGGGLNFGPDGKLYLAVGDNGNGANAQNMSTLMGKMLRFGSDGSIPADNPFVASTSGRYQAIWGLGLRNPFTVAVQPGSGRIFINDVGQDAYEEINENARGANYGWPATEGPTTNPSYKSPFYSYHHATGAVTGCAITGGAFYNPATVTFPSAYVGSYFFADFCGSWIKRLDTATGNVTDFVTATNSEPIDIKIGPDGALYYLSRGGGTNGNVVRVGYTNVQAPAISQQPASQTVSVGRSATFTVSASGSQPLSYQWQRNGTNIAGATSTSYTLPSASSTDNGARFRAVVTNTAGTAYSEDAVLTVTSNQSPTATITAPTTGTTYAAGNTISYAGSATDPETGNLGPATFTWWVDFHHDSHTHPFLAPVTGANSGQFTVPTTGETASNVWYRIHLSVRDPAGLTTQTTRDVLPRKSTISLVTDPAGLPLNLDDQPRDTPLAVQSVVGMTRKIEAPASHVISGTTYHFVSWSDGGAAAHTVSTPPTDTTYTATYRRLDPPVEVSSPPTPTPTATPVVVPSPEVTPIPTLPVTSPSPAPGPVLPALNRTIRITKVQYNAVGRDTRFNLNGEYLRLKNIGRTAVTLTGWTVRDAAGNVYTFPRARLAAGATVTIFTGKGTSSSTRRYWNRTRHLWNNTGKETARVRDSHRRAVDSCTWTSTRRGYVSC